MAAVTELRKTSSYSHVNHSFAFNPTLLSLISLNLLLLLKSQTDVFRIFFLLHGNLNTIFNSLQFNSILSLTVILVKLWFSKESVFNLENVMII